jgi:hypothetical protein
MHISNKHCPWGKSRRRWACWKRDPKATRGEIEMEMLWHSRYSTSFSEERIHNLLNSNIKFSFRFSYFGAWQKHNGAWRSNKARVVTEYKHTANKKHRLMEKKAIINILKNGEYDDDIGCFYVSTGYWD